MFAACTGWRTSRHCRRIVDLIHSGDPSASFQVMPKKGSDLRWIK
jgi:hypothetical protein